MTPEPLPTPSPSAYELADALLDAFPRLSEWEQLVSFALGVNLSTITLGRNLREVAFSTLRWADNHGRLHAFLQAAQTENPDNSRLRSILTTWLERPAGMLLPAELGTDFISPHLQRSPFTVPYPPNPAFVGRTDDLERIEAGLKQDRPVAITGPGGMGKTQLAAEFTHSHRNDYPGGIFWLFMSQPNNIPTQIATLAGPSGFNIPGAAQMSVEDRLAAVQAAWREPIRRLLIFDGCEDPALLKAWRPTGGGSHVLVTSRRANWPHVTGVQHIALAALTRNAAQNLLLSSRATREGRTIDAALSDPATLQAADAVCRELGDLPLALALAAAYLEAYPSITLDRYQARLKEQLLADRSLTDLPDATLPTDHAPSVAATFALSYDQLDATGAAKAIALAILHCAAHCALDPIPRRLLLRAADLDPDSETDTEHGDEAVRRLSNLGLIEDLVDGTLRLHRLLAAYARARDPAPAAAQTAVGAALTTELNAINETGDPQPGIPYLPHAQLAAKRAEGRVDEAAGILMNSVGWLLQDLGQIVAARALFEAALTINEQVFGPSHPVVATTLHNLGNALQNLGEFNTARALYTRALTINEQTLGATHPATAKSLNNLASLLHDLGDLRAARSLYKRALRIHERRLGSTHPLTATSLLNLAYVLQEMEEPEAAAPLYQRALAINEKVLGPDHPLTAHNLRSLGYLLHGLGDLKAARLYFVRALSIRERVLGPLHPDTAQSIDDLANVLQSLGEFEAAQPLQERALAIREQVLGPGHPDTAVSLNNLASLLKAQGDVEAARPLYERALAIREQVLGPAHPDTAISLWWLGVLAAERGDYATARPLLERAYSVFRQARGRNHSLTHQVQQDLGYIQLMERFKGRFPPTRDISSMEPESDN